MFIFSNARIHKWNIRKSKFSIQIQIEGREWHASYVVLREKVTGDSGSVGEGMVLLERVMLVTAIM